MHTYIYIYIYIYVNVYPHTHIHTHTHVYIYTYIFIPIYMYIYTHKHISICMYIISLIHLYLFILNLTSCFPSFILVTRKAHPCAPCPRRAPFSYASRSARAGSVCVQIIFTKTYFLFHKKTTFFLFQK